METNKWLTELPEIKRPCIIVHAFDFEDVWYYNLFEIDEEMRVLHDDEHCGNIDEIVNTFSSNNKFFIIDLPKKITQ
jgi:hypothetical protein